MIFFKKEMAGKCPCEVLKGVSVQQVKLRLWSGS